MRNVPLGSKNTQTHADDAADLALLERIAAGDRAAFEQFYHRHYHALLRFICRITGQLDAAQEGVNDVMLVVWRSSASFARRSKVTTWLMGIAYRKALRLAESRRRWRDRFKALDPGEWNELSAAADEPTEDRELEDWLERGMRRLPAKQRAVVELTYIHGYSYEEIAAITECPVNTVKTRMFHARAKLKRVLPSLGGEGS